MAPLTTKRRNALDDSTFAFPKQRKMPLDSANRVRNALARFNQVEGVSDAERSAAKGRIKAAARKFGIKVSDDFSEWAIFAEPLLVAGPKLELDLPADFGEVVRLPYVKTGEWNFRDSYGQREITDEDLDTIVRNFDRNARRQDLAVTALPLNEEHAELPEDADPATYVGRGAVGWIQKLERTGDTVYADVELNRLGEQLIRDDRYRAVSPELLWNWIDPETDEAWGKTATGLALSTLPKMKGLATQGTPLVAASERALEYARAPRVLAFAEASQDTHIDTASPDFSVSYAFPKKKRLPLNSVAAVKGSIARFQTVEASEQERDEAWKAVRGAANKYGVTAPADWRDLKAAEAARWLLAEPDPDEEADEPALCIYQPPVMPIGCCPGYTRQPNDDNDGDVDVCVFWKTCNGYIPCGGETTHMGGPRATPGTPESANYYREEAGNRGAQQMTDTNANPPTPAPPTPTPPPPAPAPATPASTTPTPADFAEFQNMLAAERAERQALAQRLDASEAARESMATELRARESAERLGRATERIDRLRDTGRISPAQHEKLVAAELLTKFAETPSLLDVFEAAPPNSVVPLRETGTGEQETRSEDEKIAVFAENYRKEQAKVGTPVTVKDSILFAARELNRAGYRG